MPSLSGDITALPGGILAQGNTGGSIVFSGSSKSITPILNIPGVRLIDNTGATISFTNGGPVLNCTAQFACFTPTGGGIDTVEPGSNPNGITTTTGVALNVSDTTIGQNGMTFRSISAGTAGGAPTNAIVLNNTGNGGMSVQGDGVNAGSGGTIQHTTGDSIVLTSANVGLNRMNITNSGANGIFGTNVLGFSLDASVLSDIGRLAGQGAIHLGDATNAVNGLSGTAIINNTQLSGSAGPGAFIETHGTATATVVVTNSTIQENASAGVQATAKDQSNLELSVGVDTDNNAKPDTFTQNGSSVQCTHASTGLGFCYIYGNTFTDQPDNSILVSNAAGPLDLRLQNNSLTTPGTSTNATVGIFGGRHIASPHRLQQHH
ncbi:MAG: hypothetical protein J2P17_06430 [Mycobacterium sp.]|nr:hypothetical protein [Mycobacterium sp.]